MFEKKKKRTYATEHDLSKGTCLALGEKLKIQKLTKKITKPKYLTPKETWPTFKLT